MKSFSDETDGNKVKGVMSRRPLSRRVAWTSCSLTMQQEQTGLPHYIVRQATSQVATTRKKDVHATALCCHTP